ncbi:MAG: dienelactone hydrolase family protein, partial [Actinomycetota bacterium]|nr:dienelactone hydrolase family protein [Actinomycetota bacterium]
LPLDAAVDCYGAFVLNPPPEGSPLSVGPLGHLAPDLHCPLLGLFGAEDQFPSPDEVAALDALLTEHGKAHEFHTYEDAGHAFFATNRTSYRPEAANDGWERIERFFQTHLAG